MRRIVLACTIAILSVFATGVLAPAHPAHAAGALTVAVTPSTVAVGSTATVSGAGFTPNYYVFVYWQRPDGTTNGTWAFTNPSGAFSFTLGFLASHGTGTEWVTAYDYATGQWAPWTAVTVTGAAPPPTTTKTLSASPNPVMAGNTATITGTGFSPNNYVFVQWTRPNGTSNGVWVMTDASGSFSFTLGFLASNGCGTENLMAYDYATGAWSGTYAITVTC
jgi:hypothetical protein